MTFTDAEVVATFADGRIIGLPLDEHRWLRDASEAVRRHWTIDEFGTDVWWPDLDEGIGLWTFLGVDEDLVYRAAGFKRPTDLA